MASKVVHELHPRQSTVVSRDTSGPENTFVLSGIAPTSNATRVRNLAGTLQSNHLSSSGLIREAEYTTSGSSFSSAREFL